MRYIVIIGDGMADYPLEELDGRTPLQAADTPNMNRIAAQGRCGLLRTIPEGMKAGSDIANLSILGYDPRKCYTGRGPLEAASIGVELGDNDLAFRCNLITEEDGRIKDYCADHINSGEARALIEEVGHAFSDVGEFYPGVSYRHLFVLRNSNQELETTPPHDVLKGRINEHLVKPRDSSIASQLNKMLLESKTVLSKHEVNLRRMQEGKNPGNMLWLWGQGRRPRMEPLQEKYGIKGAVVSAVDLIKGIGYYAGMEILEVEGATGYYDTNYEGKAKAAVRALGDKDYVYVHVESIDEASHAGDLEMKLKTIEDFDKRLVERIVDAKEEDLVIALLTDHATPISARTHTADAVPFAILGQKRDDVKSFNEVAANKGSFGPLAGEEFMRVLLAT
ncbi:MAG: cofactor-independent phosphoglycerate mutase [Candidatus Hydrothermarchaeota archaeon]|nr:cofactor-independent phosphoglycerate mutase [Candidatus Hydrothermarchaeota archaeon]